MKKTLVIALGCLAGLSAFGQSKEEKIKELIKLTRPDSVITATLATNVPQVVAFVQQQLNDTADRPEMQAYARMELGNAVHAYTQEEIATTYDNKYTEEEIDDLLAFFSSSAGRKWRTSGAEMEKGFLSESYKIMTVELRELLTIKIRDLMAAELKKAEEEKAAKKK